MISDGCQPLAVFSVNLALRWLIKLKLGLYDLGLGEG